MVELFSELTTFYLHILLQLWIDIFPISSHFLYVLLQRRHIILKCLIQLVHILLSFFTFLANNVHQGLRFVFDHLTQLLFLNLTMVIFILEVVLNLVRQEINLLVPQRVQLCFRFFIFLNLLSNCLDMVFHELELATEYVFSISHPINDLINSTI